MSGPDFTTGPIDWPDAPMDALNGEIIPPDDDDTEFQAHKAFENLLRKCGSRTRALKFWHEIPKEHGYEPVSRY